MFLIRPNVKEQMWYIDERPHTYPFKMKMGEFLQFRRKNFANFARV